MGLFVSTQEINMLLGKPQAVRKKADRFQIVPVRFFIPTDRPRGFLAHGIHEALIEAEAHLEKPKVKGNLPEHLRGPYLLTVYEKGQTQEEEKLILSKEPRINLQGVMLDEVELKSTKEFYKLSTKLVIPWRDIEQAGEVDGLGESQFMVYVSSEQEELPLEE